MAHIFSVQFYVDFLFPIVPLSCVCMRENTRNPTLRWNEDAGGPAPYPAQYMCFPMCKGAGRRLNRRRRSEEAEQPELGPLGLGIGPRIWLYGNILGYPPPAQKCPLYTQSLPPAHLGTPLYRPTGFDATLTVGLQGGRWERERAPLELTKIGASKLQCVSHSNYEEIPNSPVTLHFLGQNRFSP